VLDLDFSPEQELLRQTVRDVLSRHCPLSVVREMEDDPIGYPAELWEQLGNLDLVGLLLPEKWGGSGMTLVEGVALYEEFGRALAPVPHLVSAVLAGGALAAAGTADQRDEWLPEIASGRRVFSVAWLEPESGFGPLGVQTRATASGEHFALTGSKRHVAYARAAHRLIVLARTGDRIGDVDLFLVDPASDGVTMEQRFSIGSDTQYDVTLDGAPAERIGDAGTGWGVWQEVMADAHVLTAAQAIGGARYALDITVQYAKDREQFDKPLGAFQAIAHYLADAATAVDGGEQLVHEAAWARSNGRPSDQLVPAAKLFACTTFRDLTAMAQQVFGGIGFTVEFDIQLYFRRAKLQQLNWSDSRALEEMVAASVLD
jgi:alkylation response protein AidB-like acyl-CoA dehydrogenase